MSYIKLFINVSKKGQKPKDSNPESLAPNTISEIFKEPLENLFDKPEIIKNNFDEFLNYSENYYNNLVKTGVKVDFDYLSTFADNIINIDQNNEVEYYRYLFLLEFLGTKINE